MYTAKRNQKSIREKFGLTGAIIAYKKMADDEIEEDAERLQKEDQNNTKPIWDYISRLRTSAITKNIAMERMDGADCQGMSASMK